RPPAGRVGSGLSRASALKPYYAAKPNPLMMRSALRSIDAHSESTVAIGDRMETDIVAGIEAGMRTNLVLTGSTDRALAETFPFRPTRIVASIANLIDEIA